MQFCRISTRAAPLWLRARLRISGRSFCWVSMPRATKRAPAPRASLSAESGASSGALGRAGRAGAAARGGRGLALGQAVDLVVEQQDLQVEVAAQRVDQVVAADREQVAVAADDPDVELRVGELDAGGDGGRAAVDGVEAVGLDIVGEARGAADAGDEHGPGGVGLEVGQGLEHGLQDRVVAAAGAPADLLVGGVVLGLAGGQDGGVHGAASRAASIAAVELGDGERLGR